MNERDSLLAEQHFLVERIAALPEGARLTRRSAEARLQQVGEALAAPGPIPDRDDSAAAVPASAACAPPS